MRDRPTCRTNPFMVLSPLLGFTGDFLPRRIQFGLILKSYGGVIQRRFDNTKLGLQVSFPIKIDQQLTCGLGRVDHDLHRFARLVDQLPTSIQGLDAKPVSTIALGLKLELALFAIGLANTLPGFS